MEKIIRCAKSTDIDSIKALWNECFPDDLKFAKFFFEKIYEEDGARLTEVDGEIAGMLHVFPRTLKTPYGELFAKYIYGVGTAKKYRGRRIAGDLLDSEAQGCDLLVLIPQDEGLFDFYKKYGFSEICEVEEVVKSPESTCSVRVAGKSDIPFINEIYENALKDRLYAVRDRETWELLFEEYEAAGGGFLVFEDGYCAYYEKNGKLITDEFISLGTRSETLAGALEREITVRRPGRGKKLAVIRTVSEKARGILFKTPDRYINLMHN